VEVLRRPLGHGGHRRERQRQTGRQYDDSPSELGHRLPPPGGLVHAHPSPAPGTGSSH